MSADCGSREGRGFESRRSPSYSLPAYFRKPSSIGDPHARCGALLKQPVARHECSRAAIASFQLISSASSGFVTRVVTCWSRYRCKMGLESGRGDVRGCSQTRDESAVNLREYLSERVLP